MTDGRPGADHGDNAPHANQGVALFTLTASPTISTTASPDTTLGNPVSDTATLADSDNPGGRITLRL